MKHELKMYETQDYFYLRRVGEYGIGNHELMEELKRKLIENHLMNEKITIYGIARDNPLHVAAKECRYDVGVVGKFDTTWIQKLQLKKGSIVEGIYLEFIIEHTEQGVNSFWQDFLLELKENEMYLDSERVILEQYPLTLVQKGFCKMCVPIR